MESLAVYANFSTEKFIIRKTLLVDSTDSLNGLLTKFWGVTNLHATIETYQII